MKEDITLVISVRGFFLLLCILLTVFMAFGLGQKNREGELAEAWNEGYSEGYRRSYCDSTDKFMNKLGEIIARYEKKPKEKIPLLNEILRLKGE